MKKMLLAAALMLAVLSLCAPAQAHCGTCGVGDAAAEDSACEADCDKEGAGKDCPAECPGKGEGHDHPEEKD